jgi:chemotaxis-related protein WspB
MLFLLFQLGADRFALDVGGIDEVLPLVAVTPLPLAPLGVAGLFDYRGTAVPAIDLSALALGQPARRLLNTRIVLIRYPDPDGTAGYQLLGLIAERATHMLRAEPGDFVASGIDNAATPYLGPVLTDVHGLVQRVDAQALLPPGLRNMLFRAAAAG